MEPKEINTKLLENFPELKDKFVEVTSWQDGINTGSIVVFEDVFLDYIINVIDKKDSAKIKQIFEFIENMVKSTDYYEKNVVEVGLIENFYSYKNRDEIIKFLLPKSLESYKKSYPDKN